MATATYDFVVKHPAGRIDPGRRVASPDTYKIDGYDGRTGAFLWRIDLGWNINLGIWFSPMVVRDLDGDGKAEVCLRTAPYAATREQAFDPGRPFVLDGPEYLAVYDGETGKEIDKVDWIERGNVTDWADRSGNRSSRHMMGVAYLDGKTPSVLVVRGTYGLMKVDAWTLRRKKLEKLWRWTNERAPFKYHGQGQHSIKAGDIDGDGFDEILNGSIAIDHDGRTMWSTGLGHGDRFYVSDIDPAAARPRGLVHDRGPASAERRQPLGRAHAARSSSARPRPTNDNQVAGGLGGDIDPSLPGAGVLGRQVLLLRAGPHARRSRAAAERAGLVGRAIRCARSTPAASSASGRAPSSAAPRAACSTSPTSSATGARRSSRSPTASCASTARRSRRTDRRVCLMQDPLYRNDVTHRSMGYPHVPMTSYFLGITTAVKK